MVVVVSGGGKVGGGGEGEGEGDRVGVGVFGVRVGGGARPHVLSHWSLLSSHIANPLHLRNSGMHLLPSRHCQVP